MSEPTKVGKIIAQDIFGGFPPTKENLGKARQYRQDNLPSVGICRQNTKFIAGLSNKEVEGWMYRDVYLEIHRQLATQTIDALKVCAVCHDQCCPITKGNVNMSSL